MSGETASHESGWSVDTLKEYVNQRFADNERAVQAALVSQEKAVAAALAATKEAVAKAEVASDKRFESVNEFRKTLSDQTNTFLPRPEYDANHKALEDKIQALTDRMNVNSGKSSGIAAGWGYLIGAIGVSVTIISVILAFNN